MTTTERDQQVSKKAKTYVLTQGYSEETAAGFAEFAVAHCPEVQSYGQSVRLLHEPQMTTLATEARQMRQQAQALRLEAARIRAACRQSRVYIHAHKTTVLVLGEIIKNGGDSPFSRP